MLEPFPDLEKPLPEDPPENALASVDEDPAATDAPPTSRLRRLTPNSRSTLSLGFGRSRTPRTSTASETSQLYDEDLVNLLDVIGMKASRLDIKYKR